MRTPTVRRRLTHRRLAGLAVVGAMAIAACGGGDSALDAGLDDEPETEADDAEDEPDTDSFESETADPDDETEPSTSSDDQAESDEPGSDTADEGSSGESSDDGSSAAGAPCPVDALDAADGPVEITMWFGLTTAIGDVLQSLADEYNASQDQVVVTIENQTDYETTIDNYFNLGADDRPDLMLAPEFVVQTFAESESFIPVESCIEATGYDTSTFLERGMIAYSYDGVQWGVPFNVSSPVLFYLRPALEAAGLDPDDPPVSFEEVRAASEAIVDSGTATYGLVLDIGRDGGGATFEQFFGRIGEPYVDNGNGREGRATEALFGSEAGLEILTFLRDMNRDGLSFNVGENAGGQDAFFKLVDPNEPGAMTVSTSAALGQVIGALDLGIGGELTPDDLGIGPLMGPTDEVSAQVSGAAIWLPAERGDAQTAAAWDFAQFLLEPQSQSTWSAGTGYVPMRSEALDLDPIATLFAEDPRYRVAYDQVSAPLGSIESSRAALGPQREVRQVIADMIATVYADPANADLAALLADAEADANQLIETYNALN
ncbi:MAG: extracellular solute-binding protein [Actinomycetota bacterium]